MTIRLVIKIWFWRKFLLQIFEIKYENYQLYKHFFSEISNSDSVGVKKKSKNLDKKLLKTKSVSEKFGNA